MCCVTWKVNVSLNCVHSKTPHMPVEREQERERLRARIAAREKESKMTRFDEEVCPEKKKRLKPYAVRPTEIAKDATKKACMFVDI